MAGETLPLGDVQPLPAMGFPAIGVATPPPSHGSKQRGSWTPSPGVSVVLEPGAEFGPRYRIVSLLGQGGMGIVYKARDLELNRTVALKLVRPELTADAEAMQRFKHELLLASRISHKNILRIHDLGDAGGVKFISMAFVDGEDLSHLLKKRGRLSVERVLHLARQLCAALDAAHSEGIIHRDLKPQNILIDEEGSAFISDFGLAKSLETGMAEMTHTGQLLGTPRYMSPEQVQGKPADARSDIYALGLMLYELLTGDVPFKSDSIAQLMLQRISQKVKNPTVLNPAVPDYLARIILRCLDPDQDRRYQSTREILTDLEAEHASQTRHRSMQITLAMPEKRGSLYILGAVLLLALVAIVLFSVRRSPKNLPNNTTARVPSLAQGKYLAVLPFRVLGGQASLGYLAEGLDESLSAKLFNLNGVHIVSPDAVEKAIKEGPVAKIASDLGANLLVQGTLQGAGGRIAIVVNLENLADGRLLWAQEFTGVPRDLLTLEDQISGKLVDVLNLHPGSKELAQAAVHPTENIAAYDLYLKGQNAMRGLPDGKTIQKAIDLYQSALKQDPGFALAYAGLADASLQMYDQRKDRLWVEQALNAAQQAQQLNSNLPQVYMALGNVYSATGRNSEAVDMLQRAVHLAPNSDEAYRLLGKAFENAGEESKAIEAFRKAIRIDPYYWVNAKELGDAYDASGDDDMALAQFQRITQIEPDNAAVYEDIGNLYMKEGKFDRSVPALEKALQLSPGFWHYSNLGLAYFFVRRYTDAAKMLQKAVALGPNQEAVVGNLAEAYLFAGQKPKAAEAFAKAIALAYKELQVNPRDAATMGDLAIYYAFQGESAQALQFAQNARSIDPNNPQYAYNKAVAETLGGQPERAVQTLRAAFRMGFPPVQAASDPQLTNLQSRPDFKQLIGQFSRR
jgi:serine/threonine protein kinase/tetratricopeptide (TPR) repeat protein